MIKETERLKFRHWTMEDADRLFELTSNEYVGPRCGWIPPKSVDESRENLEKILINDFTYCIIEKSTGEIIGDIGIDQVMEEDQDGNKVPVEGERELGFWIGYPYWNKGYMTETVMAAIDYCFDELKLSKIHCGNYSFNPASGRVQEKCGFKYQETKMVYSLPYGKEVELICRTMTPEERK